MSHFSHYRDMERALRHAQNERRRYLRWEDRAAANYNSARRNDPQRAHYLRRIALAWRRSAERAQESVRHYRDLTKRARANLVDLMGTEWVAQNLDRR